MFEFKHIKVSILHIYVRVLCVAQVYIMYSVTMDVYHWSLNVYHSHNFKYIVVNLSSNAVLRLYQCRHLINL